MPKYKSKNTLPSSGSESDEVSDSFLNKLLAFIDDYTCASLKSYAVHTLYVVPPTEIHVELLVTRIKSVHGN